MHPHFILAALIESRESLFRLAGHTRVAVHPARAPATRLHRRWKMPQYLTLVAMVALAESAVRAATPTALATLRAKEIAQWVATDDYACTLYADGSIVSWNLQDGHVAGRASFPQSPAGPPNWDSAVAIARDGSKLACAHSSDATAWPRWKLDILSMPALSMHEVFNLSVSLDRWDAIAELDYTKGRFSYEGRDIARALDLKTNQTLWEFKNPSRPATRPMISPPPVFVLPDFAGYIAVVGGKAAAHDVKGNVLWSRPLPHPVDYWNSPDRMHCFSQNFVIQDRDEKTGPIAAFDRRGGSPRWQSSVANSGDIVATDDSGEHQLFVKDGKYSLLRLPDSGEVACQLAGDQDVQFTPNGRFLIALPSLPGGAVWSRASPIFSIIDAKTGTLVGTVRVAEPN